MPTKSFSARWQSWAISIGSNGRPLSVRSACAHETSSAAEELRPAPIGTSRPDDEIGAGKAAPAPLQHQRDAEDIVGPVAARGGRRGIEIELARLVHDHGIDPEAPVGPLRGCGQSGEFERRRHDEAIVIVGVLADQIDAAWRATDRRRATEPIGELDRKVARLNAHMKSSPRTGGPAGPCVKRV